MEELEGYLQCFDEKDRGVVKKYTYTMMTRNCQRFAKTNRYPLFEIVLSCAVICENVGTCHKLIDIRPKRLLHPSTVYTFFDDMKRLLFDRGIHLYKICESDQPKLQQFLHCRDCARKAAIAMLSLFSDGRSAAVGQNRKDVGRIIGRAIWESRGIKEWMN